MTSIREISFADWQAERAKNAEWCALVDAGLPPFRRRKLRDEGEAAFLRKLGTPEALIGPVGNAEQVDAERAELLEFARRLRR